MVRNTQAESIIAEEERRPELQGSNSDLPNLRITAVEFASGLAWLPGVSSSSAFEERCARLKTALHSVLNRVDSVFSSSPGSDDIHWLRDNVQLIYAQLRSVTVELKPLKRLPHVRGRRNEIVPRVLSLAQAFLDATGNRFREDEFGTFCQAFQESAILDHREILALVPALKLTLLERIAARGRSLLSDPNGQPGYGIGTCVRSLRDVTHTTWKDLLEPLIQFDKILRQDPAGVYAQMDSESRDLYRVKLAKIARYSDRTEMEVAREALALAQRARARTYPDARIRERESHIGYYLVGEGVEALGLQVGFKPPFWPRMRRLMLRHPDEVLLPGIAILTFAIVTGALLLLTPANSSPGLVLFSMVILLLPISQAAVQLMNYLVTALLKAEILPKLDFSDGVPDDCVTLVGIPTLLLNEKQVRHLVDDLEVRYLGNHDPNVHFGLVSDLADSDHPEREDSPLVELCANLITELNQKYGAQGAGTFFFFHRHRVYNPREKGWMGWERKRGKLLDLNKLLRGQYDSFPVKIGDLSILPKVRFVITLDSDTELPRDSAKRMIGTMAHPLNQAIIDPAKNIVVAGYGILQPRVGVSVQSTARSRLAAIYAGETGIDIYTRAISDVYQDLYREGSFTGKGIYEVDTVHRVLDRRFPRNALLSHDLIEGAYARAGLASDIEVIEDYPSHYSAYSRRKHRWLRGDWQIVEWLTSRVPDESGNRVPNPISLVSRWKIFDNLRRSLVEPATFALLLFGWLDPGRHPVRWTITTICILFIPTWFELLFGLIRAVAEKKQASAREAIKNFFSGNFAVLLTLVFLLHQTLLALDAVARALVRRMVTRERLLEWETAAEAELGTRRTPIDRYLDWMPLLSAGIGILIWLARPQSLWCSVPILLLWGCSKLVALWLNESPMEPAGEARLKDRRFLRRAALHTWRYFAEFSTEEHNWLIPDNVQERPLMVAARVSPTNLGLLLNARQVAAELGYLTVPELVVLTQQTLATMQRLPKYRGHIFNWYDTRTLEPLAPVFVSSVDNGNLLACLWTLRHGLLDLLERPLLSKSLAKGFRDHVYALGEQQAIPKSIVSRYEDALRGDWLTSLLNLPKELLEAAEPASLADAATEIEWFRKQVQLRIQSIRGMVTTCLPWMLPEFAGLRERLGIGTKFAGNVALRQLPDLTWELEAHLASEIQAAPELQATCDLLRPLLAEARSNATRLIEDLRVVAEQAGQLANEMDFSFLLDSRRKLMSIGYDLQLEELHTACYDFLASESRTAMFVAIAKEDIAQDCWFQLGRSHTLDNGRPVLLSWTGTMFEYLMPFLWMRSHANTLLDRTRIAAVRSQQAYAAKRGIPWGISESAHAKQDEAGNYQYQAFGLPQLALNRSESDPLVISPYSTFLALPVDPPESLQNLRRMDAAGWFGPYGFYESADYSAARTRFRRSRAEVVRCWMAHHQGMSLLSIANFLCNNVVQRWFHEDRRVQATELLLQEKPVSHVLRSDIPFGRAA